MASTDRVKQILSWYSSDNVGREDQPRAPASTTGRSPARASSSSCPSTRASSTARRARSRRTRRRTTPTTTSSSPSTRAATPTRRRSASSRRRRDKFAGQIPLILKLNNSDTLAKMDQPCSAVTGEREGRACASAASAIGYTIYPGSGARNMMYEELRELILEAKDHGLPTVVWAYPRGAGLSKEGETGGRRDGVRGADLLPARRAHRQGQAAEGLHRAGRGEEGLREVRHPDEDARRPRAARACRARSTASASSSSRAARPRAPTTLLEEVRGIAAGGGFGSIMGRNAFQRPRAEALKLLDDVMDIFRKAG